MKVSSRQPVQTPIFKPWKGPKSEEKDSPSPEAGYGPGACVQLCV